MRYTKVILLALVLLLSACAAEQPRPTTEATQTLQTEATLPPLSEGAQVLYEKYQSLLQATDTTWRSPATEELAGNLWYYDGYDDGGNYVLYEMRLHTDTMDVAWMTPDGQKHTYKDASWHWETEGSLPVLRVDLKELDGERAYQLLLNPDYELLYIAPDITEGDIGTEETPPFRFLQRHVELQPVDMVGNWNCTHTEVEGDRVEVPKGDCTIHISNEGEAGYRLAYTQKNFPEQNLQAAEMTIVPAAELACFANCSWMAEVEQIDDITRYIGFEGGKLVLVELFTIDGAPAIGYRFFSRE